MQIICFKTNSVLQMETDSILAMPLQILQLLHLIDCDQKNQG